MTFNIDPRIGDIVSELVERTTGKSCHIVLLVFPYEDHPTDPGKEVITNPAVVTSMHPESMKETLNSFVEFINDSSRVLVADRKYET